MGRLAWWDAACGPAPHGSSSSSNRRRPDADVIHPTPVRAAVGRPRPAPRPPSPLGPSTVGHAGRRRIPRARRRPPPQGPAGQQGCSPPPASIASALAPRHRRPPAFPARRRRRPALGLFLRWASPLHRGPAASSTATPPEPTTAFLRLKEAPATAALASNPP